MRTVFFIFTLGIFLFLISESRIQSQESKNIKKIVNSDNIQLDKEQFLTEFSKYFNAVEQSTVFIFGSKQIVSEKSIDKYSNHDKFYTMFNEILTRFYGHRIKFIATGFIIDKNGLILTGSENVMGADSIFVEFSNKNIVRGAIVAVDTILDLALITAPVDTIPFSLVPLKNSYETRPSEFVMSFNKLSPNDFLLLINQVTIVDTYIICSNERYLLGPTFNRKGELIGISCYPKAVNGKRSNGIVSSNIIARHDFLQRKIDPKILVDLNGLLPKSDGESSNKPTQADKPSKLGFDITDRTPEMANGLDSKERKGVMVTEVEDNSLASDAGLEKGDLIVEFNRKPVTSAPEFRRLINESKSEVALLRVLRVSQDGTAGYFYFALPLKEQQ